MNRTIFKKFIYVFIGIIGIFLFYPNEVSAKQALIECNYQNQDDNFQISYKLTIYDDYSAEGDVVKFRGNNIKDQENNRFDNWNSLKEIAKTKKGAEMCPKFAIIKTKSPLGAIIKLGTDYSATGYYNQTEFATQLAKDIKDTFGDGTGLLDFLKGIYNTALQPKTISPAWLFRTTDKSGTQIVENDAPGNPNKSPVDESVTGNETNSKCTDFLGDPTDSKSVAWLLQKFFNYMKVLGPILVILFSTLDFTKTIMNSDEEAMKKSQKKLGIRMMCAVGIYFLPMLVTLIINLIFGTTDASSVCGIR